jgi:putative ABC transport system permease protein
MFRNFLKIAIRNFVKHKVYSLINISGLAIGMASVILIGLYIQDELSYDRYHKNADRIYRFTKSSDGSAIPSWIGTPAPLAPALKAKFPEIENYVRFDPFGFKNKTLISYKQKSFYEERFYLADPSLFEVFDFKLVKGNPETALVNPTDLIITESIAKKYFGSEEAIGKTINYDGTIDLTITGVLEDVPDNSHFKFDFVGSFKYLDMIHQRDIQDSWGMSNYYTYVLLKENVNQREFEKKATDFVAELTNQPDNLAYLQPLTDIHLRSKITRDPLRQGSMGDIYLYASIAVLILLIACINFMNLYTAKSEIRGKEVGMRKVLGAHKRQLISQFLCESLLLSILALPIAVLLVEFAIPEFNQIIGKAVEIEYSKSSILFGGLIILTTVVGLVSGSYPAFFISSFQPIKMLRGKLSTENKGLTFRNILVIFQFAASVVLIAGSLIINDQMQFVRNKKLGYDKENIVNIPIYSKETKASYGVFRNAVLSNPNVVGVTATSYTPSIERWREGTFFEGRKENDDHAFYRMSGDFNLIDVFGIEMVEGRSFDRSHPADLLKSYVLNESAVKSIGWSNKEAIGKAFGDSLGMVIGVAKDFHFRSLRFSTMPLAINVMPRMFQYVSIKIKPGDIPNTIRFFESKWNEINPGLPFEFYFYGDEFDKLYKADTKLGILFRYFTFLAIFIACLGLLGLASFMAEKRTKEIGIRKVLGASVSGVVLLLSKEFTKWVLLANVIAWPIAWYTMNNWLQNFAYKIDIGFWVFVLSGGIALIIALLTVSSQAIKAALSNPVEALRYE